jgi:hypothetical protein
MRATLKTSIALSLAALGLSLGLTGAATSAQAHMFMGGGGHFGGFGPHFGGGFGPMGGFKKPFPGPVGPIGWNHHHHGSGFGFGYGGYGGDSCIVWRPIYDSYGDYLGRRAVNVCD